MIACGTPEATIIKADNIPKAYEAYLQHEGNEGATGYLKNLPLQDMRKDMDDNSFIQYTWEGDKYLQVAYGYDNKSRCDYVYFFDLGDSNIKIVKVDKLGYGVECGRE